jgi:hypothetical protein
MRGWCPIGIAASIMAPRVFQEETLPSGPSWDTVLNFYLQQGLSQQL